MKNADNGDEENNIQQDLTYIISEPSKRRVITESSEADEICN